MLDGSSMGSVSPTKFKKGKNMQSESGLGDSDSDEESEDESDSESAKVSVDLSNYYTIEEVNNYVAVEVRKLKQDLTHQHQDGHDKLKALITNNHNKIIDVEM